LESAGNGSESIYETLVADTGRYLIDSNDLDLFISFLKGLKINKNRAQPLVERLLVKGIKARE
jgi:hypothetical protein